MTVDRKRSMWWKNNNELKIKQNASMHKNNTFNGFIPPYQLKFENLQNILVIPLKYYIEKYRCNMVGNNQQKLEECISPFI